MIAPDAAPERFEAHGLRRELADLNLYRMLLNAPPVAQLENEINMRIVRGGVLTQRPQALHLRELAIMRLSWKLGDQYVWSHHLSPMVDTDMPGAEQLGNKLGVREGADFEGFDAAERCLVAAVDEIVDNGVLAPETVADLRSHLESDAELVELVYSMALWRAISSVTMSLQVPLEDNYVSWPPDGRQP
ncbi:MAG: carboxymuconolactone decarboxylase family protein [Acidimicrobiia bacterium]